jgi:hypothetical protein
MLFDTRWYIWGKYYCYSSSQIRVYSRQFSIVLFCPPNYWLRSFISTDPLLSYINRCTAHYSSVLFWTQNRPKPFGSNKGYHSCSPLPSFPYKYQNQREKWMHMKFAKRISKEQFIWAPCTWIVGLNIAVRFLGLNTIQCCSLQLNSHCYCVYICDINFN